MYIEALASGLPVLAFEPNVIADAVRAEQTGIVAARDGSAIADALRQLRQRFSGHASRNRRRRIFEERYTEGAYVRRTSELYNHVVNGTTVRIHRSSVARGSQSLGPK